MYGYPIDSAAYSKNSDAKIGDIVALDDQHILLIEQGSDKNDGMRNLIYKVDLSKASDLPPSTSRASTRSLMMRKPWRSAALPLRQKRRSSISARWAGSRRRPKGWR
jgi:hypothetical protein